MAENIVREATLTDVPEMAEVFAVGFIDDDLFGRLLHPKRHEHPDDWIRHWRRDMRNHVLDPRGKCFVRTDARGMVMGCIIMRRLGGGGDSLAAAETDAHLAQRKLYAAQDQTESLTDRSADPKAIELFNQNWDDIKHYFSGPREDCWIIELLCIHPETQAKGFGRALIENAINLCKSEQPPVPLAVIASEVGDGFYEKIGFREVGRADVGGLSGIRGGSLKFYEQHLK